MMIDTNTVVSMTEANQNFSKVARTVDQFGSAVIFKNNAPKYLVLDFSAAQQLQPAAGKEAAPDQAAYATASREEISAISRMLMERYDAAYKELAK